MQAAPAGKVPVAVVPITHGERSRVRGDDVKRFVWPGYDLRPVPTKPGRRHYGRLPEGFREEVRRGVLAANKAGGSKIHTRD